MYLRASMEIPRAYASMGIVCEYGNFVCEFVFKILCEYGAIMEVCEYGCHIYASMNNTHASFMETQSCEYELQLHASMLHLLRVCDTSHASMELYNSTRV